MAVLSLVIGCGLVFFSGDGLALLLLPVRDRALRFALAFPLGCLLNALAVAVFTVNTVPLSALGLWLCHLLLALALHFAARKREPDASPADPRHIRLSGPARLACIALIAAAATFGLVHALLPTAGIDSFTNWTMRAERSFEDRTIAFDDTEKRGVAKPQYPILLHALQLTANAANAEWNDRGANVATALLTVSLWIATWRLIARRRGRDAALLLFALAASMPLLVVHHAQGYADLPLAQFTLLAALCISQCIEEPQSNRWIALGSALVAAALWTKTEGLAVAWIPWAVVLPFASRKRLRPAQTIAAIVVPLVCLAPHGILLWLHGLGFTPHGSDLSLSCSAAGLQAIASAVLGSGSLGIAPLVGLVAGASLAWSHRRSPVVLLPLAWGALALVITIAAYACTPNARFLLNGESFFRQMFGPSLVLLAGVVLLWANGAKGAGKSGLK